ncbi:MAG: NAD(P)H-dependent flavin oxidoreductase [Parvibaculales bacterium]
MPLPKCLDGTLRLPVVGSPMFILSDPNLVAAQCKAGIVGSFPALNARPQEMLGDWLTRIKEDLAAHKQANPDAKIAPFAVNQICHATNPRLMQDMETCVEHEVPIIITSLRPPEEIVTAAHSYGGVVFHDVINLRHARKAAEQGVDGLILVASGAGGHAGTLSPFALVREVREWFDGTILLSGAMGDGFCVASAQAMGADLAYMGSRFIPTAEANAVEDYKQMVVDCEADDILYSSYFSGIKGNYLKPSIARAGIDPNSVPDGDKSDMDFSKTLKAPKEGENLPKAWKDIWGCGQGIGGIKEIETVADVVDGLEREYYQAIEALGQKAALHR